MSNRPRILVVEDDDLLRETIASALLEEGYDVVTTGSGEEALAYIVTAVEPFEGLYADIRLSGAVSGWEVGTAFHPKWPRKPIVYASGVEQHQKHMTEGVFLRKPFRVHGLIALFAGSA